MLFRSVPIPEWPLLDAPYIPEDLFSQDRSISGVVKSKWAYRDLNPDLLIYSQAYYHCTICPRIATEKHRQHPRKRCDSDTGVAPARRFIRHLGAQITSNNKHPCNNTTASPVDRSFAQAAGFHALWGVLHRADHHVNWLHFLVRRECLSPAFLPSFCSVTLAGSVTVASARVSATLAMRTTGFEPVASDLKGLCSTVELWALIRWFHFHAWPSSDLLYRHGIRRRTCSSSAT